jgi:hypothetical protein
MRILAPYKSVHDVVQRACHNSDIGPYTRRYLKYLCVSICRVTLVNGLVINEQPITGHSYHVAALVSYA